MKSRPVKVQRLKLVCKPHLTMIPLKLSFVQCTYWLAGVSDKITRTQELSSQADDIMMTS